MRQIWITKAGPPEVLEVREAPDPVPRDDEVRIRVRVALHLVFRHRRKQRSDLKPIHGAA